MSLSHRNIRESDYPALYIISWDNSLLIIRIHRDIFAWLTMPDDKWKLSPIKSPLMNMVASGLRLEPLVVEEGRIGFNGVFLPESVEPFSEFVSFGAGLLRSDFPDDPLGRANRLRAICGTLCLITKLITKHCDIKPASTIKQLLELYLEASSDDRGRHDVCAETSPEFRLWVEQNFQAEAQHSVTETLFRIHSEIAPIREPHKLYSDQTDDGRISLTIPGDNCQFYAKPTYGDTACGWECNCHNMDEPIQQILTLVGLAQICDMIRTDTALV